MSHLLKKNKKTSIAIKLIFYFVLIILFLKALLLYDGNKFYYFVFTITSFYLLLFSFRKNSFFYENFLGTFLFLGFWLKFSFILSFNLGFGEGIQGLNEKITLQNFDNALIVSIVGFLGIILFGHIREIYLNLPIYLITNDKSHFWATKKPLLCEEVVFKLAFTAKKIRNQDQKARLTTTSVDAFEHE